MKNLKKMIMVAAEGEFGRDIAPEATFYTGIGKVNAAWKTYAAIQAARPDIVINLGTAGSAVFDYGTLVNCTGFVQRDMNLNEFSCPKYVTPLGDIKTPIMSYGIRLEPYAEGVCGTGDSFDTDHSSEHIYNLVDMEGFAIAEVCRQLKVPLLCMKFISDGANEHAAKQWKDVLKDASEGLRAFYSNEIEA